MVNTVKPMVIPSAEALGGATLEKSQDEKSSAIDILSAAESTLNLADLPAMDDVAKAQEKQVKERNGAFREWLFEFVPGYVTKNRVLIQEMEDLKDHLALTPAEKIIFEESLIAIRALQTIQEEILEKLKAFPVEDFLQKAEKEQVQIALGLYSERYRHALNAAFVHAYTSSLYLGNIFVSHQDELDALPRNKFSTIRGPDIKFGIQLRIMQGVTRFGMLPNAAKSKLISPHEEFTNLCEEFTKRILDLNELDRVNPLCRRKGSENTDNNPKNDRKDFLKTEKAEQFLSFLRDDTQKIAYFKLLQNLHAQGPSALKDNRRKSIFPIRAEQNIIDEIKSLFPFLAQSIDELLKAARGKEDDPQTKENIDLAFKTITSLLLDVLEPDFVAFTKKMEHIIPQESSDFELEAEKEGKFILPESWVSKLKSQNKLPGIISQATEKATATLASAVKTLKGFFSGPPADIYAAVPFTQFAHFVKDSVEQYNSVGEDFQHDERLTDWNFVYVRDDEESEIPDDFQENDSIKAYHDERHVFTVTPTNIEITSDGKKVANGVGVTVHRHEERDMFLAVKVMIGAMAQTGNKEICISIDSAATPEAKAIVYAYALVILSQSALPLLTDENGNALSRRESKLKLQKIEDELKLRKGETPISEWYSAQVKNIKIWKEEDNKFLQYFDSTMLHPMISGNGAKQKRLENVERLIDMALINRNLAETDLVKRIVKCAQYGLPETQQLSPSVICKIEVRVLLELRRLAAKNKQDNEELSRILYALAEETLKMNLEVNQKDYSFLRAFNSFIQTPLSAISNPDNPNRTMDMIEVVSRLQLIFAHNNLTQEALINKIVAYAQKVSSNKETEFTSTELQSIEEALKVYFDVCIAKNAGIPPADIAAQLYNLAAQKLGSANVIPTKAMQTEESLQLDVKLASGPKSQTAPQPAACQEAQPQKEQLEILQLQDDDLSDTTVATEKSDLSTVEVAFSEDATDDELERDVFSDNSADSVNDLPIKTPVQEQETIEAQDVQTLEFQIYATPVREELQKMHVQEIVELKESELSLAQKEFQQRITALYEQRKKIGTDRRFARALAAYALFLGEIRHENFDLAESMIPDIFYAIENAEKLFKTDEPKSSSAERRDAAKKYEKLLQKTSSELKLELQHGNSAFESKTQDDSLHSFSEQILAQDLEAQQLLKEILEEAEKASSEDQSSEEAFELESLHSTNLQEPKVSDSPKSDEEEIDDLLKSLDDEIALVYSGTPNVATAQPAPAPHQVSPKITSFSFFGNRCAGAANQQTSSPPVSHSPEKTAQHGFPLRLGVLANGCAGAVNKEKDAIISSQPIQTLSH